MTNNYENFLELIQPRYGFLKLRKRKYNAPEFLTTISQFDFSGFSKEQTEEALKMLQEKGLLNSVNIQSMKYVMNGEIDLKVYNPSLTRKIFGNFDYDLIPESVKKDNEDLTRQFLEKDDSVHLWKTLIQNCPSLTDTINKELFEKVLNNYAKYEHELGEFQSVFIEMLSKNSNKDLFLKELIDKKLDLTPYFDLYKDNELFLKNYFLMNPDKIDETNYKLIPSDILGSVFEKYLDSNVDSKLVNEMFLMLLKLDKVNKNIDDKIVKLYSEKRLELDKTIINGLIKAYPVQILKADFNNLSILIDYYKNQNANIILMPNFQEFMKLMFEHNVVLDSVFSKAVLYEMTKEPDVQKLSNLLKQALNSNIIDDKLLNNLLDDINLLNMEYIKVIFDYYKQRNIEVNKDLFLKKLNHNNYNIDVLDQEEDIFLDVKDNNKTQILEFLTKLKEKNYLKTVYLTIDVVDRDFVENANRILPNQIKISPKKHQTGEIFYDADDILHKDKILQTNADVLKGNKSRSGNVKELSPFEKFMAAYLMTTRFGE